MLALFSLQKDPRPISESQTSELHHALVQLSLRNGPGPANLKLSPALCMRSLHGMSPASHASSITNPGLFCVGHGEHGSGRFVDGVGRSTVYHASWLSRDRSSNCTLSELSTLRCIASTPWQRTPADSVAQSAVGPLSATVPDHRQFGGWPTHNAHIAGALLACVSRQYPHAFHCPSLRLEPFLLADRLPMAGARVA